MSVVLRILPSEVKSIKHHGSIKSVERSDLEQSKQAIALIAQQIDVNNSRHVRTTGRINKESGGSTMLSASVQS